jgi:hypothetical protein
MDDIGVSVLVVSSTSIKMNEVDFQVIEKAAGTQAVKFNVENGLQGE